MNNKDVLDILRRTYSDTAPDILDRLSFDGLEKEEAVVTPVRKRYAAAVAIYAAACLVVAILLPFFIGNDDPKPNPGVVPYNTETVATGDDSFDDRRFTEYDSENTTVTSTEDITESVESETTAPKETTPIIEDPIPVETSETKEPVTVSPDPVPVTTPNETEPPKPVTTPKETEPPKPVITYPAPAVSERTLTSITKSLYGCEYTISVDKPGYKAGDIVKVTVTLENKGESTLTFSSGSGWNYLKNIGFYEDNTAFRDTHTEIIDYPDVITSDDLTPGEKWETTREYCTCECDPFAEWTIKGAINFVFDGEAKNESLELDVYHALPEEFSDGSPYSKLPKMTDFSSEVIEKRKNPFADIESVVLYRNGAAVPLAADDPMLVRLLNFMTYSDEETLLSAEVAGFYGKAVYEAAMASDYRLEIVFKNTYYNRNDECPNIHVFSSFDRVIITGDEVYLINDQEEPNYEHIGYIDEYQLICTGWLPYACHFSDEEMKSFDILTYAGFSNYTGG